MARELIINASLPEIRIALLEDGQIQEILIERASDRGIVGNIYKGRVTRVLPGMQAAFVDIGLDKAAFLYVDDIHIYDKKKLKEEQERAARDAEIEDAEIIEADDDDDDDDMVAAIEERLDSLDGDENSDDDDDDDEVLFDESDSSTDGDSENEDGESEEASSIEAAPTEGEEEPPVEMGTQPVEGEGESTPATIAAPREESVPAGEESSPSEEESTEDTQEGESEAAVASEQPAPETGRRRGRGRRPVRKKPSVDLPSNYYAYANEKGTNQSDRSALQDRKDSIRDQEAVYQGSRTDDSVVQHDREGLEQARLETETEGGRAHSRKKAFKARRGRDRRVRSRASLKPSRNHVNIKDLLEEGQEVLVQIAKDPIASKGARLTCHVSLPGRHLVCMPTIDHVGVSRRIESDHERRALRRVVENSRPDKMGFIVRTASSGKDSEIWVKNDINYLKSIWDEIVSRSFEVSAPALVYEDLNSVLRAIRDWINEDIDKIIIDSRFYYDEIKEFVGRFMPSVSERVQLYQGDIPVFDAYGLSTQLHRALERRVWLKSGGYIVIDQAEALVAIDVNTGRYVGRRNLEDTILKTNLEAVEEIAYQLRLRNCGGIIILDLIDMEKEESRRRVVAALEEAVKKDRARPTVVKVSDLGLIEMTRKRTRDTLVRALCESCSHCEGKGFTKSKHTVAYEILRELEREGATWDSKKILVQASPEVVNILALDEQDTVDILERRYKKEIILQGVDDFHLEQFEVTVERAQGKRASSTGGSASSSQGRGNKRRGNNSGGSSSGRGSKRSKNPRGGRRSQGNAEPGKVPIAKPKSQTEEKNQDNIGNVAPKAQSAPREMEPSGNVAPAGASNAGDDFSEEDRLAYLRAQAAQDAALAGATQKSTASPSTSYRQGKGNSRGQGNGKSGNGGRGSRGRRRPSSRGSGSGRSQARSQRDEG